jgi:hypothetical protein
MTAATGSPWASRTAATTSPAPPSPKAACCSTCVDRATQAHGLATPLGFISEVGWTVDNLVEAEVVGADGQARVASREAHPDRRHLRQLPDRRRGRRAGPGDLRGQLGPAVEVTRRWDPGNLFRSNRNVRP